MLHHQKADDGNGKLRRGLERHFTFPEGDFDRWHYLMQVNQARAVAAGIEHWRSHWPVCAGTVVWQLNDCWPVTSWAAIDGDGREKPLYHELRRLYADRLLTVRTRGRKLVLAAVNQAGEPWAGVLRLRRMSVDGEMIDEAELNFHAARRTVTEVTVPPELVPVGPKEFLVADAGGDGGVGRKTAAGTGRGSATGAGSGTEAGAGSGSEAGASRDAGPGRDASVDMGMGTAGGRGRGSGTEAGAGVGQDARTRPDGVRALYFPAPDREIPYPRPEFDVDVAPGAVTVTARTLVRDLLLQADRLDPAARAERGLVTLLPGERVTIGVSGWETPDADAARSALYCLEPSR